MDDPCQPLSAASLLAFYRLSSSSFPSSISFSSCICNPQRYTEAGMAAALKKELSCEVCFSSPDGRSARGCLSLHACSSPLFWRGCVLRALLGTPRRVSTRFRLLHEKTKLQPDTWQSQSCQNSFCEFSCSTIHFSANLEEAQTHRAPTLLLLPQSVGIISHVR